MTREKQVYFEGIDLGDGVVIEEAYEKIYKYLGILERDDLCQQKMKEKIQKEYYKRVRLLLKSKLNGAIVTNAINIWAIATAWYGAEIINWDKGELDKIDLQTGKLLNMHRGLYPRFQVDRP